MNDTGVAPVPSDEIPAFERRSGEILREKQALYVRINKLLLADSIVTKLALLALAGIIFIMLPLKQWIPQIVGYDYATGEHHWVRDSSQLPKDKWENITLSTLWTYVENCESYTLEGAPRRYAVCSALSTGHAQAEYQEGFQHDTTNSPQWRLKDQGFIYAEEVPTSATLKDNIETCHKREFCEAELSYWLVEKRYGQAAQAKKYYTIQIDFIFVDELPLSELATFNPASLKVIATHKTCTSCGKAAS